MTIDLSEVLEVLKDYKPKTEDEILEEAKKIISESNTDFKQLKKNVCSLTYFDYNTILKDVLTKTGILLTKSNLKSLLKILYPNI